MKSGPAYAITAIVLFSTGHWIGGSVALALLILAILVALAS